MGDSGNKGDFWKGYSKGQSDAGKSKSIYDIAYEAVVPGAGPTEGKSDAFKEGYKSGKQDGTKKK